MFTFATRKRPSLSFAISSRTGAIILQGPHHEAQKSTRTGTGDLRTAFSKLASLMLMGSFILFVRIEIARDAITIPHRQRRQFPRHDHAEKFLGSAQET